MDGFGYLFAFYWLLLGLAVALVAVNLGAAVRSQPAGVLAWVLGGYIVIVAARQWLSFWDARDILPLAPATLAIVVAMAVPYCFVASAMFAVPSAATSDGDAHIVSRRRALFGALMVPVLVSLTYNALRPTSGVYHVVPLVMLWLLPLAVLGGLTLVRTRGWIIAGLILLIVDNLLLMVRL